MSIYLSDQKVEFLLKKYSWFKKFLSKSTNKISKKDLLNFKEAFDAFKTELNLTESEFDSIKENPKKFHALVVFRKRREQFFAERYSYNSKNVVECIDGKNYYATNWIHSKSIKIFNVSLFDANISQKVEEGLKSLIQDIKLDFNISISNFKDPDFKLVQSAVFNSLTNKGLDIDHLEKRLIPLRQNHNYATVIITDKKLVHESIHQGDLGYGSFKTGFVFFGFKNANINLDFVKKLAKHECGHLLGLQTHHEIMKVADYQSFLYEGTGKGDCNMCPSATNISICRPCIESIIYFWKGIEHHTKIKFFK